MLLHAISSKQNRGWAYTGVDPFDELLLGPTFAIKKILQDAKLQLSDIGVIEFHEAFAGQVLVSFHCILYK